MKILTVPFLFAALLAGAQSVDSTKTTIVKNVTTTVVETTSIQARRAAPKKIAVFVQNRTKLAGMDDEVDGVRDRLSAALSEVENLAVVDSAQVADTFRRYKVTAGEEKSGLIDGVFTGGSVPAVAKMLGCDYIAVATIVSANSLNRNMSGRLNTVFTLRMTLKVMDANGASVDGMPVWTRQLPVLEASGEPMNYYQMLFDQWAADATGAIAQKAPRWRVPSSDDAAPVSFSVSTTIDKTIAELESQTRGAKGEQLQELRRIAGGATVELDGAVIGSAPGTFFARPGLHQLRVRRMWMKPFVGTVNIAEGLALDVALELNDEGIAKWGTIEALRADLAKRYADAARERGVRVNIDTTGWRDVGNAAGVRVINDK